MKDVKRRDFLKKGSLIAGGSGLLAGLAPNMSYAANEQTEEKLKSGVTYRQVSGNGRPFNGPYKGNNLNHVAFPIGGIGAGMFCMEGTGRISHMSVRNSPDVFKEPFLFGAISVKGIEHGAKVLEGPVPEWMIYGRKNSADGARETTFGFPRFQDVTFNARFPFGKIALREEKFPLEVEINGWSPFIPSETDNSSLPVGAFEYKFKNTTNSQVEAVFSFHSLNFMRIEKPSEWGNNYEPGSSIKSLKNGFVLSQNCLPEKPHYQGDFAIFTNQSETVVDHSLFQGGWWDSRTILWKDIAERNMPNDSVTDDAEGASLYVPINLAPGEEITIPLMFAWYVPDSNVRKGGNDGRERLERLKADCAEDEDCCSPEYREMFYQPWYSGRFKNINELALFWESEYHLLKRKSQAFSEAFFQQTLPDEVIEAIAANLSILKSPTVLRQKDGRMWAWEGCKDDHGCCHGTCTHVWNYAQAISRLFPDLERGLRETEFNESQSEEGHQKFRASLPIRETGHGFHAAADGQLGGPMKVYREWRISGDTEWMKKMWPRVQSSIDYCIKTWDPKGKGILEEPHHNTYDIEFWGPDGMCTSFYLGALKAVIEMGKALKKNISRYQILLDKGIKYMESELYDGEYFIQKIVWEGLEAKNPVEEAKASFNLNYSEEALELLKEEGPKYQYGKGCLSDGVLGCWIATMSGLDDFIDKEKVKSHLVAIYKYNFLKDLRHHVNPQRPGYAMGNEGGLLLCSWPKGGKLTLPFVYSNEVWTGIEYQVASHLIEMDEIDKGLDVVREVRKRYDGRVRNPFDEYECGHWYARAMSSYGLIQSLTGVRYDAVSQTLYVNSKVGDNFDSFFSCDKGFGIVGLKDGEPYLKMSQGSIKVKKCLVSGKKKKVTSI